MRRRKPFLVALPALLVFAAVVLDPSAVRATPNFPAALKRELGLTADPPCSTCHAGGVTGRGTVTTPFGAAMRSRGLVLRDEESLKRALMALTAERRDSDGDGETDIDELKAGTDPNVNLEDPPPPPPEYGCATAPGPRRDTPGTVIACALAAFLGTRRRRAVR